MANRTLFNPSSSTRSKRRDRAGVLSRRGAASQLPVPDAVNEAGGVAHRLRAQAALAQYAATGCLAGTYYATDAAQLTTTLALAAQCDARFIAQVALHCRTRGGMKDMPALLCAVLAARDGMLLEQVFDRVIDNGRMLRSFVQIVRSGATGRRSLGSRPRRLVRRWLEARSGSALLAASVGREPSLADVVRLAHPRPADAGRAALYGWIVGRPYDAAALPACAQELEAFTASRIAEGVKASDAAREGERETTKTRESRWSGLRRWIVGDSTPPASTVTPEVPHPDRPRPELPDVPFQMLSSLPLTPSDWTTVATRASWQTLRQGLNMFARHGVFESPAATETIAARLADPELISRARALPYQLLVARRMLDGAVPAAIGEALEKAMSHSLRNVPTSAGHVAIGVDVSGSMQSPITGVRAGATTAVRCVDVAALFAAAILARNPQARVLPFDTAVREVKVSPRDSVFVNAQRLAAVGGGGTDCSTVLRELNRINACVDLVVLVSDNQSWAGRQHWSGTGTMMEWRALRLRCPQARLVCLDLQPCGTTQAVGDEVLNVGGFSDAVFEVIDLFSRGLLRDDHWVACIKQESLN